MSKNTGFRACRTIFLMLSSIIFLMFMLGVVFDNTSKTNQQKNIAKARELYRKVEATKPANVNHERYIKIIEERLACFVEHHNYADRINICGNDYQKKIVKVALETSNKRPMIGKFITQLNGCVVMFNMCRGKQKSIGDCILFEKQCIDHFLDTYWRGEWKTSLKGN